MARALEKMAEHAPRAAAWLREIVCHRCGTQCLLPAAAVLEETVCVGCIQRLRDEARGEGWGATAARALADRTDKATAPGPGYGLVSCPHCDTDCVVEVGETQRTGCSSCLRPLGAIPLVRTDLTVRNPVAVLADDDVPGRYMLRWPTPIAARGHLPSLDER